MINILWCNYIKNDTVRLHYVIFICSLTVQRLPFCCYTFSDYSRKNLGLWIILFYHLLLSTISRFLEAMGFLFFCFPVSCVLCVGFLFPSKAHALFLLLCASFPVIIIRLLRTAGKTAIIYTILSSSNSVKARGQLDMVKFS